MTSCAAPQNRRPQRAIGTASLVAALDAAQSLAPGQYALAYVEHLRPVTLGRAWQHLNDAVGDFHVLQPTWDRSRAAYVVVGREADALIVADTRGKLIHRQPLS